MKLCKKIICVLLTVCMLFTALTFSAFAEEAGSDWVTFMLVCNEGMNNEGGNVGNTQMIVSLNPDNGLIRLMVFTWDTFMQYEGYDVPQLVDQAYRNNGPEEVVKIFNDNFDLGIEYYLSLNYLNLANLIDSYGGVDVAVTRAERNALNGIIANKKQTIQNSEEMGLLSRALVEMLTQEYYLNDYGEDTHLNGLQAVGFGWLQYDSVYNCCIREVNVIANLFKSVGSTVSEKTLFYNNDSDVPDAQDNRRVINLDEMTEEDIVFLCDEVAPIFNMSANNLPDELIAGISIALAKTAYKAAKQGVNVLDALEWTILPLEAKNEYDVVAGKNGHLIDYDMNREAMCAFLYAEIE